MKYISIGLIWLISLSACAQPKSNFKRAIQTSRDSVQALMKRRNIPGLAITVMVDGEIAWSEGFGFADLEQKVKVDPAKTKFRIGSISKSLTAAGLAKLYEANKIILDSSIYYYLPNYPRYKYRFTIKQLGGHLAGVRHYKGNEWYSTQHYSSVTEGLSMFKDDSLNFKPGLKYQYTSHGFNLLSAVMEKAARQNFLVFMQKEVFEPLKLVNTKPDVNDSIIDSRTRFYQIEHSRVKNAPYVDNSYKWAGGGFISTSNDIATFGNALLGNTFLKPETIKLFTTPQKLNDGSFTTYGIGFASGKDSKQNSWFGHSGGSVGGTTDMVIYPEKKIVVVVLTNLSDARLGAISRQVAQMFVGSK
ncbi:MAG TPA: serine hydrolase domain-containing protein [Chryseosolibacter sp.]